MSMSHPVCDAHVHVFDPQRYPYATPRRFTPGAASTQDLKGHIRNLGLSHVVLVQPSVYGDNNACLLNAMNDLIGIAGGVVVISPATSSREVDEMHHMGVRGARLNLVVDHEHDPEVAIRKIKELDSAIPDAWHIQLHVSIDALGTIFDRLDGTKRVFVLDHLGLPDVTRGTQSFAWQRLLRLVGAGNLFVKLSAPYLSSVSGPPYSDLEPFVNSLLRIRPDRLLWGSNWPHTQGTKRSSHACEEAIEAFRQVDDLPWLELCSSADEQASVALFNENARRIYDFI
jgi:2-pyrone-4,6-dicarboxylate lactonase